MKWLLAVVIPDDGPDGAFYRLLQERDKVDAAFAAVADWLKNGAA